MGLLVEVRYTAFVLYDVLNYLLFKKKLCLRNKVPVRIQTTLFRIPGSLITFISDDSAAAALRKTREAVGPEFKDS